MSNLKQSLYTTYLLTNILSTELMHILLTLIYTYQGLSSSLLCFTSVWEYNRVLHTTAMFSGTEMSSFGDLNSMVHKHKKLPP